eukprot:s3013_g4.t1
MQAQPIGTENQAPGNGAVNENELVQVMMQLQNDVRALQNRPMIPLVAQPPIPILIGTPHGAYATPMIMSERIAAIDQTGSDVVLSWLLEFFTEGLQLQDFMHSGLLPRLDMHIGSLMMDPKHFKGELGMQFQTYAESCQIAGKAPRGRAFLFMLNQHFRLDLNRGSNLTQQALLDLSQDGFTAKDLENFIHKIEYVLNAIPESHQPSETTRFTWLYSRVKKCKLLQRHIDRIRDSSEKSKTRSWEWLMNKIKTVVAESREDQNEESIRASLQPRAKPVPKAAVAKDDPKGGKDDTKGGKGEDSKGLPNPASHPKGKPKAKPKASNEGPKGTGSGKGDGKGKGKSKTEEKKDAKPKPKAKAATVPCLFYPKGICNRGDQCPFLHEPKAAAKPKAAAAATATVAFVVGSAGVPGAQASSVSHHASNETLKKSTWSVFKSSINAIVRPFITMMSFAVGLLDAQGLAAIATLCNSNGAGVKDACPCVPAILSHQPALFAQSCSSKSHEIEWIADSGAGRDLGSERA